MNSRNFRISPHLRRIHIRPTLFLRQLLPRQKLFGEKVSRRLNTQSRQSIVDVHAFHTAAGEIFEDVGEGAGSVFAGGALVMLVVRVQFVVDGRCGRTVEEKWFFWVSGDVFEDDAEGGSVGSHHVGVHFDEGEDSVGFLLCWECRGVV